ncbi:MAG: sulfotransferase family protein [Chloroflexi bacterium]|nr:sulfotransferase family protein [Chloroflexota bacterium]
MNQGIDPQIVTIVSGLPRSGTSMMMKMLEAGGMQALTDHVRTADEDNPKGYYEFERVKQIEHDHAWLPDAQGKVVKMISALLKHLPLNYTYQVIFMRRNIDEILASQKQMLIRRGESTDKVSDEKLVELFGLHLQHVMGWIDKQPNVDAIYVEYNKVLASPVEQTKMINQFMGHILDENEMVGVVDQSLYRQRQ